MSETPEATPGARRWHDRLLWPLLAIPLALWYVFVGFGQGMAATPTRRLFVAGETCIWTGLALLLLALVALAVPALRRWTVYGMAASTVLVIWVLS